MSHGPPQPNAHHQKLHALAGKWVGTEELQPSPWGKGGPATGRFTARVDLGGFFVISDYLQERDGQVSFRGHSVFGWDDKTNEVTWYWVDSMGTPPAQAARGTWDGDTLTLVSHQDQGDGRYTFTLDGPDRYTLRIENSFDGGASWTRFMEGSFHRE